MDFLLNIPLGLDSLHSGVILIQNFSNVLD